MNIERRGGAVGDFPFERVVLRSRGLKSVRRGCLAPWQQQLLPCYYHDHRREESRLLDENLVLRSKLLFGMGYIVNMIGKDR